MGMVSAVLRLTRIEHSVMLIIAVLAAEIISGGLPGHFVLLLSLITPAFISMGAFAINDYFDVDVDRKNRKMRPIVTGEISANGALAITAICMIIGMAASVMINAYCFAIAAIFAILSLAYSYRLKDLPIIGNAYVAFSMSIPFIFGNYVSSTTLNYAVLLISVMIFIAGLAREIDGTVRDYKGDRARKARTLPTVIGIKGSSYLAFVMYLAAIFLSMYLFLYVSPFAYNLVYGILIAITDIMLFYSGLVFALLDKERYGVARNVSLAGMALALICILVSVLVAA